MEVDKKSLTETDIISKFISPAVSNVDWDLMAQVRQEVKLRDGKVIVRGQLGMRTAVKSADIVLYHKPSIPLVLIEAIPEMMQKMAAKTHCQNSKAIHSGSAKYV